MSDKLRGVTVSSSQSLEVSHLPDDLLRHIGSFINIKAIVAKERFDMLTQKLDKIEARTNDQWIGLWINGLSCMPKLIKMCAKTIKVQEHMMFVNKSTVKIGDVAYYARAYVRNKLKTCLVVRKHQYLDKPICEGQIKDFDGKTYTAKYIESPHDYRRLGQQGCVHMKLYWDIPIAFNPNHP